MKINTQRLLAGLLMVTVFASCSRPVAYFQKSPREHFATAKTTPAPAVVAETVAPATPSVATPIQETTSPATQLAQANTALDQMDAMVRNDSKLAADKSVQKRLNRVRALLAAAPAKSELASTTTSTKKMNLMERLVMKKMNKKINKQLAPNNPNKTMVNSGVLAAGAVLVIVGLILLLVGSSTGVGVVLLLAGAVILLVGLL